MTSWFLYMILTEKKKLYTGITTDVERRFRQHKGELRGGAKYFRLDRPLKIVYLEACENRSIASKKESAMKKLSRINKEKFCNFS